MSEDGGVTLLEFWRSAAARQAVADGLRPLLQPVRAEDYPDRQEMRQCDHGREPASGRHGWSSIWLAGSFIIERMPTYRRSVEKGSELADYFFVREFASPEEALQVFASMFLSYDDDFELRHGRALAFYGGTSVAVTNVDEERHLRSLIDDRYCEDRPGEGAGGMVMCRARGDREDVWLVLTRAGGKAYATRELTEITRR